MINELRESFKDVFNKNLRTLVYATIGLTVVVFAVLLYGFSCLMSAWYVSDVAWVKTLVTILGGLAFLVTAFMIFPVIVTFTAGFFFDKAIEKNASLGNVSLRPPVSAAESVKMSGMVAVKGISVNALLTLFGLIPVLNLLFPVLFYVMNGKILGQEYYYSVATRYITYDEARDLYDKNKLYFQKAGIVIALLLTIPGVNMVSPLVGITFMQRMFLKLKNNRLEISHR